MEKQTELDDELRPEYDMKSLLKGGVRGKYAARYRSGTNLVLLEPEVARAFPNEKAVNEALKLVIKLKQVQAEWIDSRSGGAGAVERIGVEERI